MARAWKTRNRVEMEIVVVKSVLQNNGKNLHVAILVDHSDELFIVLSWELPRNLKLAQ